MLTSGIQFIRIDKHKKSILITLRKIYITFTVSNINK